MGLRHDTIRGGIINTTSKNGKFFIWVLTRRRDFYTNYYYEPNTNYTNKYKIPKNFSLYKNLVIDGTRIYSIYKKIIYENFCI